MLSHHNQYQERTKKMKREERDRGRNKEIENNKETQKIPLLPHHLYQCFQGLYIVNSNYLISDAS
jgi:hypothetical protein